MATILSLYLSDKSKPAHSIPRSPLQVLLCALYMKGCYFIQGVMKLLHSVLWYWVI